MEEIEAACRIANIHDFISRQPEGYNTPVGNRGLKLSGGEKQKIAIARALYKKVSVLLLDEATSALDNVTELEINRTLQQLKQTNRGLTILSIAHRESSLSFCDRTITIE